MAPPSDAAPPGSAPTDSELVRRYLTGDQGALGEIYERYADRVHDLCLAMLHSPDDAADAFQDTFLIAAQKLEGLRDRERLRPWLYSVARNQCRARLRARKRTRPESDAGTEVGVEVDMTVEVARVELAELMADAQLGLNLRDQEVLDLHMRHGLEGEDLATVLEVSTESAYKLVQRVRSRVERSLGSLLVARHGRADCGELAELLGDWDGTFTPLMRKRVGRHVDDCSTCSRRRKALLDPSGLAGAMPMQPAPASVHTSVLAQIVAASPPTPSHEPVWADDGFPASSGAPHRARSVLVRAVALGILAVVITAGVLALDQDRVDDVSAPETTTTRVVDPTSTAAPPTVAGVALATTTTKQAPTTSAAPVVSTTTLAPPIAATTPVSTTTRAPSTTTTPTTTTTTTTTPTTTTTTTTTTVPAPPIINAFRASPPAIVENSTFTGARCAPNPMESNLSILATADVQSIEATWTIGTHFGSTPFTVDASGRWNATFGPFPAGTVGSRGALVEVTAIALADGTPSTPAKITITLAPC
jgi:RNA polymerase sigma factor (sigma-70 family)